MCVGRCRGDQHRGRRCAGACGISAAVGSPRRGIPRRGHDRRGRGRCRRPRARRPRRDAQRGGFARLATGRAGDVDVADPKRAGRGVRRLHPRGLRDCPRVPVHRRGPAIRPDGAHPGRRGRRRDGGHPDGQAGGRNGDRDRVQRRQARTPEGLRPRPRDQLRARKLRRTHARAHRRSRRRRDPRLGRRSDPESTASGRWPTGGPSSAWEWPGEPAPRSRREASGCGTPPCAGSSWAARC